MRRRRTRLTIREATPTRRRPASEGMTPFPCLEEVTPWYFVGIRAGERTIAP
jgi:hypothetical protein